MRQLTYVGSYHLGKLHQELLAIFPDWRGVLGVDGRYHEPKLIVGGDVPDPDSNIATNLILDVPDNADQSAIEQILAAHDPTPPQPPTYITQLRIAHNKVVMQRQALSQMERDQMIVDVLILMKERGYI